MKEENIGVLSAGERFGFKGFEWMWTCTPWYISDAGVSGGVRFVSGTGSLSSGYADYGGGVAPACVFNPKNLKLHRQVQMVEA